MWSWQSHPELEAVWIVQTKAFKKGYQSYPPILIVLYLVSAGGDWRSVSTFHYQMKKDGVSSSASTSRMLRSLLFPNSSCGDIPSPTCLGIGS